MTTIVIDGSRAGRAFRWLARSCATRLIALKERRVPRVINGTTYYSTKEAAAELGIAWASVRDAIRRGTLAHEQFGARLNMVPETALEDYRHDHLGQGSQGRRIDPTKPVTKGALYARAYRARKRAATTQEADAAPVAGEDQP
jgi:hypothetical protein